MIANLLAVLLTAQADVLNVPAMAPVDEQSSHVVQAIAVPPQPEDVMAIPAELRQLLDERVPRTIGSRKSRLDRLISLMFDEDGLAMEYAADATYTVAEAFRIRKANCLTFTLMTIALAREAGLSAYPQEIERTLSWSMSGDGTLVQSAHINAGIHADGRQFTVDVATNELLITSKPQQIDDQRLLALYYNNRAMELMLQGDTSAANRWLGIALSLDSQHASSWNNAGVLALRRGALLEAEHDFQRSIALNPSHSGALANIVSYYQRHGNHRQAEEWRKRAERAASYDPLHQFLLGMNAEQRGDLQDALKRYGRAAKLGRDERLFHLTLARLRLQLGDHAHAREALQAADRLGRGDDHKSYQAKADKLRRLIH